MTHDEVLASWEAEKAILLKELRALPAQEKRSLIQRAAEYRSGEDSCNSVYMGGMAHSLLRHALGGSPNVGLPTLLEKADDERLDRALAVCAGYIKAMLKNPVARCKCCNQIVPAGAARAHDEQAVPVTLTYTNYRGETSKRTITPKRVWFGSTEWHPEPQWLLKAYDHDKAADRDFALKDFAALVPEQASVPDGFRLVPLDFIEFVKSAPVSSGVCCCGDDMATHAEPMSSGHTPVDQWDYSLRLWIEQIEAASPRSAS